jgi:hypothetical protein
MTRSLRERTQLRELHNRLLQEYQQAYNRLHEDILNSHVQLRLLDQEDEEARRQELNLHLVPGSDLKVGDIVEINNPDHNQETSGVVIGATRDQKIKIRTATGHTIRRVPNNLTLIQE